MLSKTLMTSACAAAILTLMSATPALAQGPIDSRTEFTFNQPVELPGVTLPPGTYIFRFADSDDRSQSDAGAGEGFDQQDIRVIHDHFGAAPETVRRRRAPIP